MPLNPRLHLASLLLGGVVLLGCSEAPPVPTGPLFEAARAARARSDWPAAGAAFAQALEACQTAGDADGAQLAQRGVLQAQAASAPGPALAAARAWLDQLAGSATVDLYGGLTTDFKLAGAPAEGLVLCELGLEAFPGDFGLVNTKQRLEAALPPSATPSPR